MASAEIERALGAERALSKFTQERALEGTVGHVLHVGHILHIPPLLGLRRSGCALILAARFRLG